MGFQDKDFGQKLMRILNTLDEESITDPDLTHALLHPGHAQIIFLWT